MQLIDEKNHILRATNLIHHGLDSLFELATIFCPGYHEREIERDDPFIAQQFRHLPSGDFLSQPFDDGGLSNSCFTEQHWVVFGASAKNLNYAFDFAFTANQGIERTFRSCLREVAAEFGEQGSFLGPRCRGFFAGRARQLFSKRGQTQAALH